MKNSLKFGLFICLFLLTLKMSSCAKKLVFIEELFRHGARYPIYITKEDGTTYATDQNSEG